MTNKPPRPPSLSQYRPSDDRAQGQHGQPGPHPQAHQGHHAQHPGHPGQPVAGGRPPPPQRGGGQPRPRRRRSGLGSFLFYGFILVVAALAAGLTFLIVAPPTDLIKSYAIKTVKEKTGRDLVIKGATQISFYPSIGISMGDVSLSAPPDMGGAPLAHIADLTVAVKLMPLLSSEVVVDTLILTRPKFNLRVDKQGRKSWDFARVAPAFAPQRRIRLAQAQLAQETMTDGIPPEAREFLENSTGFGKAVPGGAAQSPASKAKGTNIAALEQLRLGDVRIIDGTIRYIDAQQNVSERVDALNVSLDLASISAPFKSNGNLKWKGETVDFNATLTSVKNLMQERPAKLKASVSGRPVTAIFDGTIKTAGEFGLDGALNADSKSMRVLAAWFGTKLPKVEGFGPLSIQGRLKAKGNRFSMLNSKIGLDGATATGDVTVTTGGVRPHVKAKLKLSVLDLNKYMANDESGTPVIRARPSGKPERVPAASGPQVRGYSKREGWSREPIDLSSLGAVDANADLTVGRLLYQKIKVGRARLSVKIKNKLLQANLTEMQLYKGGGRGIVTVNARKAKTAAISSNFSFNKVDVQPLMTDAADIDWLSGTGNVTMALTSRGGNQQQIVNALGGKVALNFVDGAIVGFNLPGALRSIGRGQLTGLNRSASEKTDFSDLTASFKIARGIATNTDLRMSSPLLRVTGAGKILLPARTVDYTVKPKLVTELQGQGGGQGLAGIIIPVRIHGPFANLSYTPDIKGILSNPDQALDAIKQIGKKFKGKNTKEIIDGILGGLAGGQGAQNPNGAEAGGGEPEPAPATTENTETKKKSKSQEVLDGILGGGQDGESKVDAKKLLDGLFGN